MNLRYGDNLLHLTDRNSEIQLLQLEGDIFPALTILIPCRNCVLLEQCIVGRACFPCNRAYIQDMGHTAVAKYG